MLAALSTDPCLRQFIDGNGARRLIRRVLPITDDSFHQLHGSPYPIIAAQPVAPTDQFTRRTHS